MLMPLDRGRFVVVHPCSTFSDCRQLSTSLNAEVQKTAKIGVFRRPHFRAVRKVLWKMVKNCVCNRTRLDEIDTKPKFAPLKSKFFFRFC